MNATKIVAVILIVLGILGLVYGSFTYTKDTRGTKIGAVELSIKDKEKVKVPVWAGVSAITAGGVLLLFGRKK
jgi:TRAP-type C4-dicarboxylate transport system permease small subunit